MQGPRALHRPRQARVRSRVRAAAVEVLLEVGCHGLLDDSQALQPAGLPQELQLGASAAAQEANDLLGLGNSQGEYRPGVDEGTDAQTSRQRNDLGAQATPEVAVQRVPDPVAGPGQQRRCEGDAQGGPREAPQLQPAELGAQYPDLDQDADA